MLGRQNWLSFFFFFVILKPRLEVIQESMSLKYASEPLHISAK